MFIMQEVQKRLIATGGLAACDSAETQQLATFDPYRTTHRTFSAN